MGIEMGQRGESRIHRDPVILQHRGLSQPHRKHLGSGGSRALREPQTVDQHVHTQLGAVGPAVHCRTAVLGFLLYLGLDSRRHGVQKTVVFIFYAGFYSSVVFLMLMTVQRYMAVVRPLSDWEKGQGFSLIPVAAWLVSISVALPAPIFSSVQVDPGDFQKLYCEYNSRNAYLIITYKQNVFFVFAFAVMGFCYTRILQTIFKTRTNKRHRTIKLIFCIVVVFFLGWAPYNLVIFLHTFTHHQAEYFTKCDVTQHLDYAEYICKLMAFSHCCLNPVFYVFAGIKFRNHVKAILLKIFRRQINVELQYTRTGTILSHGSVASNSNNGKCVSNTV
ncbi:Chemokine XC receptor 1 [Bagarius yarrelli]|uniref:Chemokine XC receptor 1 n=1 Tax=Bagarius yarrelli TaxID=175774 RepID=A0A556U074_BAGYA|nr:Chemokine XC receptor 1 [Bagarius yarrelli]